MVQLSPSPVPDLTAVRALWVSVGSAVLSALAVVFVGLQWWAGRSSAKAALRSAEASEESARSARMAQRPWVSFQGFQPTTFDLSEEMAVKTTISNFGPTPALNAQCRTGFRTFKASVPDALPFHERPADNERALITMGMPFGCTDKVKLTAAEIEGIKSEYLLLLLYGKVAYSDVNGGDYQTSWCFRYNPETKGLSPTARHNSAT